MPGIARGPGGGHHTVPGTQKYHPPLVNKQTLPTPYGRNVADYPPFPLPPLYFAKSKKKRERKKGKANVIFLIGIILSAGYRMKIFATAEYMVDVLGFD